MKTQRIEFTPPKNSLPEGVKEGQEFDLVLTMRLEKGGKVCVTKFGDMEMDYDKDGEDKSYVRPGMDDEIKAMQSAMKESGDGTGSYS